MNAFIIFLSGGWPWSKKSRNSFPNARWKGYCYTTLPNHSTISTTRSFRGFELDFWLRIFHFFNVFDKDYFQGMIPVYLEHQYDSSPLLFTKKIWSTDSNGAVTVGLIDALIRLPYCLTLYSNMQQCQSSIVNQHQGFFNFFFNAMMPPMPLLPQTSYCRPNTPTWTSWISRLVFSLQQEALVPIANRTKSRIVRYFNF
jgi:hypothetical protein